jgi:hypothetical protein
MAPPARSALIRALAQAVADLTDVNLVDLVLGGWRKLDALRLAAEHTLRVPGDREVIELAKHKITSIHHPYVDVVVDEHLALTMHFELRFELDVQSLVATVSAGSLVAIGAGDAHATGLLAFEGLELARGEGQIKLPLTVELGGGVPLVARQGLDP